MHEMASYGVLHPVDQENRLLAEFRHVSVISTTVPNGKE
jgi:hypothetical protein